MPTIDPQEGPGSEAWQHLLIEGPNFSGRSAGIEQVANRASEEGHLAVILPPEVEPALSGLMPNVESEVFLHRRAKDASAVSGLIRSWSLERFHERNPYTLSGGEQTLLVLACKLALRPWFLGLDCALEQLDPNNLEMVEKTLGDSAFDFLPPRMQIVHNDILADLLKSSSFERSASCDCVKGGEKEAQLFRPVLRMIEPQACQRPVRLEVEQLSFAYPKGVPVFSNLELKLEPGRVYHLAGPNGAGKSTLARILCGILKPSRGRILAAGQAHNAYRNPGQLVRMHFQSPNQQLFEHSVAKELDSLDPEGRRGAVEFAGLDRFIAADPFDLPYVLKKRLALAITLFSDSPWLIVDEPSIGQDGESRGIIGEQIRALADAGRGVILISHHRGFVSKVADEVIHLQNAFPE